MENYSTFDIKDWLERCESTEEYLSIRKHLGDLGRDWSDYIKNLIENAGLNQVQLAKKCGVSRQGVIKWLHGSIPKTRDIFIRIGMAAGYDVIGINELLEQYGYSRLYAKNLEDSIYLYILNSQNLEHTYDTFLCIKKYFKDAIFKTNGTLEDNFYETSLFTTRLLSVNELDDFLKFVEENSEIYATQYKKLYAYIKEYIAKNLTYDADNLSSLENDYRWSASLKRAVSEINQETWYPRRNKLISLGIHLNMTIDELNEMLGLAHMKELYAKNVFESAIIYAMGKAELEELIYFGGIELCMVVKEVLQSLDFEDVEFFMDELPDISDDVV